jgi:hypothetical protein
MFGKIFPKISNITRMKNKTWIENILFSSSNFYSDIGYVIYFIAIYFYFNIL